MPSIIFTHSAFSACLAALPQTGDYFSLGKVLVFLAAMMLWAHNAAWAQQDLKKLRVPGGMWVWAIFGTGVLCLAIWLLVPIYWVGLGLFAVLYGVAIIGYVVFRNKRVAPAQTVLTMAHFQRLTQSGGKGKTDLHGKDRVRIKDSTGKTPPWPKDPEEHAAYQAMQDLLFDAIWRRASNVRIDLLPNQPVKVVYKVDGVDRAREPLDMEMGPRIFDHLKRISGMNPEEHRRPQGGGFNASIGAGGTGNKSVDVDAKTSGSTAGQRMLLKLFSEEAKFRLPDVGFTKPQLEAMQKLIAKMGLDINHFDLIEANEAFSIQALADGKELGWDWDRVNVNGGAVALGHPIGASGTRILTTLIYALKDRGLKTGAATLCLGGGNAVAMAIEIV